MKRFLKLIVVFFAILAAMLYGLDYILNKQLPKLYLADKEKLQNNNMVIMGSSRAWVQISPKILDSLLHVNSYNLGIDGSPADMQILKYNNAYRTKVKPKYVIYCVDNGTMHQWNGYDKQFYLGLFSNDSLSKQIIMRDNNIFSFSEKYLPCCKYSFYTFALSIPHNAVLFKGYQGQNKNWNGKALSKIDSLVFDTDSSVIKIFNNYLHKCKEENIKVIFVYPPYYIGAINKFVNIDSMFSFYDSFAKKYDIPILNYTYDKLSYDTAYFYNAMHLNKKGSELFSAKLAHDIDSLGLIK